MKKKSLISRRTTLKTMGSMGALVFLGSKTAAGKDKIAANYCSSDIRKEIFQKVLETPLIDTHEHLMEEKERLVGTSSSWVKSDDWTMILSHYLKSDILTAGMPQKQLDKLFSPKVDPIDKWSLLKPYWPAVKNTGYGQAVAIAMNRLYNVDELSDKTIKKVQTGYEKVRRAGFYKYILCDLANIESCQVNWLRRPFLESGMPTLLMQDLSILGMYQGPEFKKFSEPTGIKVSSLSDWHRVMDWWFNKYAGYAVAVKSQNAYHRDINYEKVSAEKVEPIFKKRLAEQPLAPQEQKALEDHLFWYAVDKATKANLPVKLHTGYYAGENKMPLSRLINNAGSATDLCRMAPETQFVFMHICYPYYEELIAAAKHYTNANVDMCWAWIINPVAAKDFLKKYLVTAPANKILTFGGDYLTVEPVLGHAVIARNGIALALSELVEEGWLSLDSALEIIDPIMHGNARNIFNLSEKEKILKHVPWA
jgi:predicted TIM-barrel fold metal-dependent hydrolase